MQYLWNFYPRSPCGERRHDWAGRVGQADFYPRSPCGERHRSYGSVTDQKQFLSTLSLRRATTGSLHTDHHGHISIHALLAESDRSVLVWVRLHVISIHALLAESDGVISPIFLLCCNFYPRSPCGERRGTMPKNSTAQLFLSTLSLRRATGHYCRPRQSNKHFYPRSPCGERPSRRRVSGSNSAFLSTLSLRRATRTVPL